MAAAFRLGRDVVLFRDDDLGARLLELRAGAFYALDDVGLEILDALRSSASIPRAAERVASVYQVDSHRVRRDVERLVADLRAASLLEASSEDAPSYVHVLALLTAAWASCRVLGWSRSIALFRPMLPAMREAGDVSPIDDVVRRAASSHPLNPQCKERALVAWRLARARGIAAELVVGVNLHPFRLHVWVECAGTTITDDAAQCRQYTPVARYA